MKYLLILVMVTVSLGCSPSKTDKNNGLSGKAMNEGGVDVGNMTTGIIPHTNASLTYPKTWSATTSEGVLLLQDAKGSKIEAQKAQIAGLSSPNPTSLQQYLKSKYPDRDYKIVDINGLKGVRADIGNEKSKKQSDIYLVSEVNDFLHIQSSLKEENDGITSGDEIISTVRVKYKGEAMADSKPKTVTLPAYSVDGQLDRRAAYSFKDDCHTYVDRNCNSVAVLFGNGGKSHFNVGAAGYDSGRIVELGTTEEIPFESIKIEGEYLVAPKTKVSIADIYTAFSPANQQVEIDDVQLKEGRVYLIRTISWPNEDMIVKMRVDSLTPDKSVTLTYQKLIYVKPEVLKKQVEEINKYTLENEKPNAEGEVTLHNRSIWRNYFYASFNFEYSTSGNMYISGNHWDLLFDIGCDGKPGLKVPHTGGALGDVVDFGTRDIYSIKKSDFPDPNLYQRNCGTNIEKGKVYGVYHHSYDEGIGAIYGAVQVLDMAPDKSWVRLKFRRIYLGPAEHFQNWIELKTPAGLQTLKIEKTGDSDSEIFYPFINKTAREGSHYYERMYIYLSPEGGYRISVDSRPYGKDRGIVNLGPDVKLEHITTADIEKLRGRIDRYLDIKQGDVIAAYLDNYYDKTVMAMRVDQIEPGKSVRFSMIYLERAKTAYSDDKD